MQKLTITLGGRRALPAVVGLALVSAGLHLASSAEAAVGYGGATYDNATQTGLLSQSLSSTPGATAGDGTAVGYGVKYTATVNKGCRVVRWGASGTTATELGNLGTDGKGYTDNFVYAINTAGVVVGYGVKYTATVNKGYRAIRWDASGTAATELGNIGTDASGSAYDVAVAINNSGAAAGYGNTFSSGVSKGYRAVRWDGSGVATELGNLGTDGNGNADNRANAINAFGTVVGYGDKFAEGLSVGNRAVRWNGLGIATELGNLGTDGNGNADNRALAVNASGTTVGYGVKYAAGVSKGYCAIRWDASGTTATELGTLGTNTNGYGYNQAYAINATGTAVGTGFKYTTVGVFKGNRAARWDASGIVAKELGNLGTAANGYADDFAYAINAAGITVGQAEDYDVNGVYLALRAVVWGTDGVAIDLNTLLAPNSGWVNLYDARSISDTGWITGLGLFDPDGTGGQAAYDRAFLLQVPEPASLPVLALGMTALLSRRRRRQSPEE